MVEQGFPATGGGLQRGERYCRVIEGVGAGLLLASLAVGCTSRSVLTEGSHREVLFVASEPDSEPEESPGGAGLEPVPDASVELEVKGPTEALEPSVVPKLEPILDLTDLDVLAVPELPAPPEPPESSEPSGQDSAWPVECLLAPVNPELPEVSFEVRAVLEEQDFTPAAGDSWNWINDSVDVFDWPYPSRPLWPSEVALPADLGDDYRFSAVAGVADQDFYVVGSRANEALVVHHQGGTWVDESPAVVQALPGASVANSVSVPAGGTPWVSTPEGLLHLRDGAQWEVVDVPRAVFPLGAVYMSESGFGVVVGGSVASTRDAGQHWELETRSLGFVAPGLAYARSFVGVSGRGEEVAAIGAYGHLLTRGDKGWAASTLFGSDTAFTDEGQFVTLRGSSQGLLFRDRPELWQFYPVSAQGGLTRVWASPEGDVFAGGSLNSILHRFADGTVELLPSEETSVLDFHGSRSQLYVLSPNRLWLYNLGDVATSDAPQAAVVDEVMLELVPTSEGRWGQSAASNFAPLACVETVLSGVGESVWQGELDPDPPRARYGSCAGTTARQFSETAFSFVAPTRGTYRIALSQFSQDDATEDGLLRLALRNGCEGWVIWDGGFSNRARGVDVGLEAGQVLLLEVYASRAIETAVPFELSIY